MQYQYFEQKNIRGISVTKKDNRGFFCRISIDTHSDSKDAKGEATGLLYVQMLLSGCEGYTRETFLDAVNLLGASIDVNIQNGIFTITFTSLDTHKEKLMRIVTAMLTKPLFTPKEIARCKQLLENDLHEEKEDAKSVSFNTFIDALYQTHDRRYVSSSDILLKVIPEVRRSDIQKFHDIAMQGQWICTLACDQTLTDKTIHQLYKLRSVFRDTREVTKSHAVQILKGREVKLVSIESKQNIELNIGAVLPVPISSKDYHAFVFGLDVLGNWGGFAGRLMSTVREKEGLTYGIYARTESVRATEHGYWRIMTFFSPDKVIQGIESTFREIQNILDSGITQIEYDRFKIIIATDEILLQDSIIKTAAQLHAYQLAGFSLSDIALHKQKMSEVTLEEVNAVLPQLLNPDMLIISGAGPVHTKAKELKALQRLVKKAK